MLKLTSKIDLYLSFFSPSLLHSSGVEKELQGLEAKLHPPIHQRHHHRYEKKEGMLE